MKKLRFLAIGLLTVVLVPSSTLAAPLDATQIQSITQTLPTDIQALINSLLAQIAALQEQLNLRRRPCLMGYCGPVLPPVPSSIIRITSPNGGEILQDQKGLPVTNSYPVTAQIRNFDQLVNPTLNLQLLKNGVVLGDLVPSPISITSQPNTWGIAWGQTYYYDSTHTNLIEVASGNDYKVRAILYSNKMQVGQDDSDAPFSIVSSPSTGTVTVTSPNGGETFAQGATYPITWTSSGFGSDAWAQIQLRSADNPSQMVSLIVISTANTGSYNWTVPITIPPGKYLIWVSMGSGSNANGTRVLGSALSNAPFSIISGGANATSSSIVNGLCARISTSYGNSFVDVDGGVISINGRSYNVFGSAGVTAGSNQNMNFYAYVLEGNTAGYVGTALAGSTEENYFRSKGVQVASVQSGAAGIITSIKSYAPGCPSYNGPSIVQKSIVMTYPINVNSFNFGQNMHITWSAKNYPAASPVSIYMVSTDGTGYQLIAKTTNTGYYDYTVSPNLLILNSNPSQFYAIRVFTSDVSSGNAQGTVGVDYADSGAFTIPALRVADPNITVSSPNGGTYYPGGQLPVSWSAQNYSGSYVDLVLRSVSTNSTVPYNSGTQATRVSNTGSYNWFVSNTIPVGQYYLRVTTVNQPEPSYGDSAPFNVSAQQSTALTCDSLSRTDGSYFGICSNAGFSRVCFNKYSGVYQGCVNSDSDCTVNNTNGASNISCAVAQTSLPGGMVDPPIMDQPIMTRPIMRQPMLSMNALETISSLFEQLVQALKK